MQLGLESAGAAQSAAASASEARPGRSLGDLLSRIEGTTTTLRVVPALLGIALLWWAQAVLIPIVMSILVGNALEPTVARAEKWGLPRSIGVPLLLIALTIGLVIDIVGLIAMPIVNVNLETSAVKREVPQDDPEVADIAIPSVVDRLDTQSLTVGIGLIGLFRRLVRRQ